MTNVTRIKNWYTLTEDEVKDAKDNAQWFAHNVDTHLKTLSTYDKEKLQSAYAESSTNDDITYKYAISLLAHEQDIICLNDDGKWAVDPSIHND